MLSPPSSNSTQHEFASAAIPIEAASVYVDVIGGGGADKPDVNVPVGNILTALSASDKANHAVSLPSPAFPKSLACRQYLILQS